MAAHSVTTDAFTDAYGITFDEWLDALRAAARVGGWTTKWGVDEVTVKESAVLVEHTDQGDAMRVRVGGESFVVAGFEETERVWASLKDVGGGFKITGVQSGRFNSKGPNFTNIPARPFLADGAHRIDADRARELRDAILNRFPRLRETLGQVDYSAIEQRIGAPPLHAPCRCHTEDET